MKVLVERDVFNRNWTQGKLYVDGAFVCYTLEDVDRFLETGTELKVKGSTAIPRGEYTLVIDKSVRFGKDMPHILDVPYFTGIRIHSGNTAADTEGCLLVGMERSETGIITNSRMAFATLMKLLTNTKETIEIEVV